MGYKHKWRSTAWRQQRTLKNRAFVDRYKLWVGCKDCGYKEHPAALEFDHVKEKEGKTVGQLVCQQSLAAVKDEIRKCEVVCANCHRIRTHDRWYFGESSNGRT
jgi:hypothetical protein